MDGLAALNASAEASRTAADRAWLDAAPVLIWVADTTKACVWFNKVWLDFTGRTAEQEHGAGWAEGVHPDDLDRCLATYEGAFDRREPFRMEYRLRRHDGAYRWLDDVGSPYFAHDGAFLGYVGSCTDVTERRQVEQDLKRAQDRLQLAQEAGGVGVWDYDIPTAKLTWSDEQKRLFGLPLDAPPPDFATFMNSVHPEDRARMQAAAERSWREGGYAVEFRGARRDAADGGHRTFLARGQVVRDAEGRPIRMVGVNLDLTERRRADDHRALLADLGEVLQTPLHDKGLFHAVAVLLGTRLHGASCSFYDLDVEAGLMHLHPGWSAPGFTSAEGSLPLGDYDPVRAELDEGRPVAVNDVQSDPRVGERYRPIFEAGGVRAFVTVPLQRDGRMVSCLSLLCDRVRGWSAEEVDLVRVVAERTWLAVENARLLAERDRTLEALRASETRFRVLAESTPQMVWSTRADGWSDYFSPQWIEYTGVPEAEHHGSGWLSVLHPDDRPRSDRAWADAVAGRAPYDIEYRIRGADGGYRWFKTRGRPLRDDAGAVIRWYGVSVDISEIVEAREALARQVAERTRERNRVFDLSRELIAVVDLEGRARLLNPAWTATLGIPEADILGRPLARLIHPDDREEAAGHMAALQAGGAVPRYENRVRTASGGWLWMAWTAVSDGESIYIVGRDTSAEREAADALREANARLEAEMAERARVQEQLVQAQKMEAIGQLTGGVAHDFNNLLQVIVGALGLIDDAEPARRRRLTEAMRQAAARGEGLTRQLLAFSRRSALKPEVFDVAVRVEAMRELLERSLRGDVLVETRFAPDLSPVEADTGEFELALLNIAVNARDAMPGGGRLVIAAEEVERFDDGPLSGRFVRVSVSDTGQGMAPEVLARVFEPFFTTKEVGKGSGLGLSQVYGFAQQSGGGVRIDSAPGEGSTVSLYLPCATEALTQARAQPLAAPERDADGRRVLLVEDDDAVAELACEMLEQLGFDYVRASSALSALNLVRAEPVDLVLSDIMMPGGVSGLDLARRIRRLRPDLPVVLATGYSAAAADARREGLTVLAKPYRLETLQAALAPAAAELKKEAVS